MRLARPDINHNEQLNNRNLFEPENTPSQRCYQIYSYSIQYTVYSQWSQQGVWLKSWDHDGWSPGVDHSPCGTDCQSITWLMYRDKQSTHPSSHQRKLMCPRRHRKWEASQRPREAWQPNQWTAVLPRPQPAGSQSDALSVTLTLLMWKLRFLCFNLLCSFWSF